MRICWTSKWRRAWRHTRDDVTRVRDVMPADVRGDSDVMQVTRSGSWRQDHLVMVSDVRGWLHGYQDNGGGAINLFNTVVSVWMWHRAKLGQETVSTFLTTNYFKEVTNGSKMRVSSVGGGLGLPENSNNCFKTLCKLEKIIFKKFVFIWNLSRSLI